MESEQNEVGRLRALIQALVKSAYHIISKTKNFPSGLLLYLLPLHLQGWTRTCQLEWPAGHPCESWVRKIPDVPPARPASSEGRETGIAILHPEGRVSFGVQPALRKRCRELSRRSCRCGIDSPDIRQAAGCFGAQSAGCSGTLRRRKSQDRSCPWVCPGLHIIMKTTAKFKEEKTTLLVTCLPSER